MPFGLVKNEIEPPLKTVETFESVPNNNLDDDAILAKAEFNIEGMTCAIGCAKTIEKKISNYEGCEVCKS